MEKGIVEFDESQLHEVYADAVNLQTSFYGIAMTFAVSRVGQKASANARVRISPQLAKVLCLLLRKQLKEYERDSGNIFIPEAIVKGSGLDPTEVYL